MKGGVIVIGSLLWDNKPFSREEWKKKLDLNKKVKIPLPIRYGRASSVNRKNTYSMVFSKEFELLNKLGTGFYIPFRNEISTKEEFVSEVIELAKAEGFKGNRIAAKWGATCLKINPNTIKSNLDFLTDNWNELVNKNKSNRNENQTIPDLNDFGEREEIKSITENWILNIDNDIFSTLIDTDFILATSNSLKYRNTSEIKYPSANEIAKAMFEGNHYEYFLRNRLAKITTYDDKIIGKILKKRYHIRLKKLGRSWHDSR